MVPKLPISHFFLVLLLTATLIEGGLASGGHAEWLRCKQSPSQQTYRISPHVGGCLRKALVSLPLPFTPLIYYYAFSKVKGESIKGSPLCSVYA